MQGYFTFYDVDDPSVIVDATVRKFGHRIPDDWELVNGQIN